MTEILPERVEMKDFDIEKLERKNIYRTPANFFADVQENVLRQGAPAPKTKVISFNWAYAAAAAVAAIFGVTFMISQDETEPQIVKNEQSPPVQTAAKVEENVPEATIAYQTLAEDLTSLQADNQKDVPAPIMVASEQNSEKIEVAKTTAVSPEVQVDQILANIPMAELADLGKNAEQDVYLDLYY